MSYRPGKWLIFSKYKQVILLLSTTYPQNEDNLCKQEVFHISTKNLKKIILQDIEIKEFIPYIYSGLFLKCRNYKALRYF